MITFFTVIIIVIVIEGSECSVIVIVIDQSNTLETRLKLIIS